MTRKTYIDSAGRMFPSWSITDSEARARLWEATLPEDADTVEVPIRDLRQVLQALDDYRAGYTAECNVANKWRDVTGADPSWLVRFDQYRRDNLVAVLTGLPHANTGDWWSEILGVLDGLTGEAGRPNVTAEELGRRASA